MRFIINKLITFNVSEKTLSNEDKTIRLSNPASRLLLVLLENKNQQVGREELLRRVWEDYGLTASGNSLSNNISILRRGLAELGVEGIIETVPKQGVTLKPDELEFNEIADDYVFAQQSMVQPILLESKKWRKLVIALSSAMISLCVLIILIKLFMDQSEWRLYKTINKCQVFYSNENDVKGIEHFFSSNTGVQLMKVCNADTVVYYDDAKIDSRNGITDVFLAVCALNKKGEINECKNHVEVAIK